MPDDFDQVAALAAKDKQIAGMGVAAQALLHLQRQAIHPAPHVGAAHRQPHPHPRGNRDHRGPRALTTAAARSGGIAAGMRTRTLSPNTTAIAGIASSGGAGSGAATTI